MADPLSLKIRPNFPKISEDESSVTTTIEYVDLYVDLESSKPDINDPWGDYLGTVTSSDVEPLELTEYGVLTVVVRKEFEAGTAGEDTGEAEEISYEVDWVSFERSLYEHPVFETLTSQDVTDIEKWENETDADSKSAYRYVDEALDPPYRDLSPLAVRFAIGIQLGQESYEDYAPIVRKTTTYIKGIPTTSDAGLKGDPPDIPCKPVGYEWRKSADRALKAGKRSRWEKTEEWTGAIKVLSDKNEIFWGVAS